MLKTFLNPDKFIVRPTPPIWINLQSRVETNLNNVKAYYRNLEKHVNSDHLLVRIIKILDTDINAELTLYNRVVEEKAFTKLNRLGLTTYIDRGSFIYDAIHADTLAYIRVNNFTYNLFSLSNSWKEIVPLKTVGHNFQDISMSHPMDNSSIGEIFYELDPVLLMLQYKYWALERQKYGFSINPKVFVYTYVLTNTIESFLNLSIINIGLTEIPEIKTDNIHKFNLLNLTREFIQYSSYISKKFRDNRHSVKIETLLNSLPLTVGTALDFLKVVNYSTRTNIKWFYYLYNLELINKLIELEEGKSHMSKHTIKKLLSELKRDRNTMVIKSMVKGDINKIENLINKLKEI